MSPASAAEAVARVAAPVADEVERDARFPSEAVSVMRETGLLSCSLPPGLGGAGASVMELSAAARQIGSACSAAGMVFAMHHSHALSLGRHVDADSPLGDRVRSLAGAEALLASATTEIATGGDVSCAVVREGGRARLTKIAPVVSYGNYADAVLVTARRTPEAPPIDQVLVLCAREDLRLEQLSDWDTLGFRGTCSPGFRLEADIAATNVLAADYATISAQTMLPTSHTLWASVWLGIAEAAIAKARAAACAAARKASAEAVAPQVAAFADLLTEYQRFEVYVRAEVAQFAGLIERQAESTRGFALAMNNLKINASLAVVEIVVGALRLCGINGYRQDHESSLGRLLRDAYGPQLMVSNDRIRDNNARMALAYRES